MNYVYFPAPVVMILRRLANVISALSISNQYLLAKGARAAEPQDGTVRVEDEKQSHPTDEPAPSSWDAIQVLRAVEWPTWMGRNIWEWPQFMTLSSSQLAADAAGLKVPELILKSSTVENSTRASSEDVDNHRDSSSLSSCDPRQPEPSSNHPQPRKEPESESLDIIHRLMQNPVLYEPMRRPRYPIVLCHGLYGFDVRGPSSFPSLRMQYWSNVLTILRKTVGAEVIVTAVPGTGSITSRSENLDRLLQEKARGRGINLMAHSMGGLDCRHLISHVKPTEYVPLSLTTVSTPHRGSPFMDWCAENIGLGRLRRQELENSRLTIPDSQGQSPTVSSPRSPSFLAPEEIPKPDLPFSLPLASLPSSFTTLLLSVLDSPAYSNLTSTYLNHVFNPSTPDDPRVKYFSVAGRTDSMSVWHPLWLPKMVLDGFEQKARERLKKEWEEKEYGQSDEKPIWERGDKWGNDGLVTVQSAKWGEFLGILEGCDHWEMRGARGIELNVDLPLSIGSSYGSENSDRWSFKDWGKFVGAWKRQERRDKRGGERPEETKAGVAVAHHPRVSQTAQERDLERQQDDAVVKSSTDKLSAVFDWLVEHVPSPPKLTSKDELMAQNEAMQGKKKPIQSDLATKMDLERFYVALSRKLYDEGL